MLFYSSQLANIHALRGVEALLEANLEPHQVTRRVALSLLFGFITMLIVEQLVAKHSHSMPSDISLHATSTVEFDAELGDLEAEQGSSTRPGYVQVDGPAQYVAKSKAFPLTLGLIIHSVADGLALGVSFFSGSAETSNLSLIVFLAIIVHKGIELSWVKFNLTIRKPLHLWH